MTGGCPDFAARASLDFVVAAAVDVSVKLNEAVDIGLSVASGSDKVVMAHVEVG